jgi:hypothetical protein
MASQVASASEFCAGASGKTSQQWGAACALVIGQLVFAGKQVGGLA